MLFWMSLGVVACSLSAHSLPADHITSRVARNELTLTSPLRWYGHATTETSRLPWGYSFDIALSGVDTSEGRLPVSGGLRVAFTPEEAESELPVAHVGDEVSILAQAHMPQMY